MAAFSRSSHRRCSVRKGVLRNFAKFTGKHLSQGLLFNKAAGLRPATLLKKRLWHRCFPVNFAKFFKNTFFTEHLRMTASERRIFRNNGYRKSLRFIRLCFCHFCIEKIWFW